MPIGRSFHAVLQIVVNLPIPSSWKEDGSGQLKELGIFGIVAFSNINTAIAKKSCKSL
jgi:hypothetical protein